ncbi:MAG: aminomethyltransferase family protein [Phycisphaerae bacterium]|nr:aminomethyltransferase family protein [Phycisphaerae bacterium]
MEQEVYDRCRNHAAFVRRETRGLLRISGEDRAGWLSNLVTNVLTTLNPGEGNYAFVVNVKGRTQFDLNILVRPDCLLLDIDRRWIESAAKFLHRYIVVERVEIRDETNSIRRAAIIGPRAHEAVERLGLGNLTPMAWLQNVDADWDGSPVLMFRHDFTGQPGAEFVAFGARAPEVIDRVRAAVASIGGIEIDTSMADTLRIEAGIPASVEDIDEEVIPPETGQIERGISYHKGCYLGQEVIERMRSHGVLARMLVGVKFDAAASADLRPLPRSTPLHVGETEVGRTMSSCISPALNRAALSLAYVKSAQARPGTRLTARTADGDITGEVVKLPL